MKLWLLRPRDYNPDESAWNGAYDTAQAFVVRAKDEAQARQFANAEAGEENLFLMIPGSTLNAPPVSG